jgi:peptide/nickel transport system substrate-binding protein
MSLAACGQPTQSSPNNFAESGGAGNSDNVLRIVGTEDHSQIDPVSYALVATDSIGRAISRQLISYEASNDPAVNVVPQPDLAEALPTISEDGLTYTFKIRANAMWDSATPRAITSKDIANGLKKICNPIQPAFSRDYFYSIKGFQDFCKGYDTENASVADIKKHILEDSVAGIETPDDSTLIITLTEPTADFIYVLSLPNAAPVAEEALDYEPNSPDYVANYISSGPYTVEEHAVDQHLYLKRSAGWVAESDPIRKANVDRIELTYGATSEAAMQQVQSGDADMLYGMNVPPATYTQLAAAGDEGLVAWSGSNTYFLWINTLTDNNNGVLKQKEVRQALQYALNKASYVQQLGGPDVAEPAIGIFGSGVVGYSPLDQYPTDGNKGDPEKTKSLLEAAGVTGLKLKLAYRSDNTSESAIAQIIQQDFQAAGVEIELVPKPGSDFYGNFMMVPENATGGEWDLAYCGWSPDWAGGAARSVYQPQFTYTGEHQGYNYTDYQSEKAYDLMKQAQATTDVAESTKLWQQVNDAVMEDPPVIPMLSRKITTYHSARVGNFLMYALGEQGDWTNVTVS